MAAVTDATTPEQPRSTSEDELAPWLAAGFAADEVAAWQDALGDTYAPVAMPQRAKEWRAAGYGAEGTSWWLKVGVPVRPVTPERAAFCDAHGWEPKDVEFMDLFLSRVEPNSPVADKRAWITSEMKPYEPLNSFPGQRRGRRHRGVCRRVANRVTTLHHLRQQSAHREGVPNRSLADFIAPKESGVEDYIGAFAVTAGLGSAEKVLEFKKDLDDYSAILLESLADRLAEAFAERMHKRVRTELWGYAADEALSGPDLIAETYAGIRPAPGYPVCPEHTEKATLWELLDVERNAGIELTESMAMWPGAAVSGWYFGHPKSQYSMWEAERWLAPNLAYEREG